MDKRGGTERAMGLGRLMSASLAVEHQVAQPVSWPDVLVVVPLGALVEHLSHVPEPKADIYQLADDLHIDADRMLHLTEVSERLGFATVASGDIQLTALGETFAEASIQTRKEIFAARIRRLPLIAWVLKMLARADAHRLERDVVEAALSLEFHQEEAEHQLQIILNWGRYAELLAYDGASESIFLENLAPGVPV